MKTYRIPNYYTYLFITTIPFSSLYLFSAYLRIDEKLFLKLIDLDIFIELLGLYISIYFALIALEIARREFSPHISIEIGLDGVTSINNNSTNQILIENINQRVISTRRNKIDELRKLNFCDINVLFQEETFHEKAAELELNSGESITILNSETHIEGFEFEPIWIVETKITYRNSFGTRSSYAYIHCYINNPIFYYPNLIEKEFHQSISGVPYDSVKGLLNGYKYLTKSIPQKQVVEYTKILKDFENDLSVKLEPQQQWILIHKKNLK